MYLHTKGSSIERVGVHHTPTHRQKERCILAQEHQRLIRLGDLGMRCPPWHPQASNQFETPAILIHLPRNLMQMAADLAPALPTQQFPI
ncbi:unnamed protein product [Periconia digitata]|uniref:Uncharacterized protein n=1 Tax=Periconia digitata TaxID=1303443 RepID=A0A9W4UD84_9PLEO|nr:unnamed protein product [Periconia digitata]